MEKSEPLKMLQNLGIKAYKASQNKENIKFSNLYLLLWKKEILQLAFAKISANKGTNTPGSLPDIVDKKTLQDRIDLQKELLDQTFTFSPFRRKMIPKPLKLGQKTPPKMRPLGIMNFKEPLRGVQKALRIVLNSIYEPKFRTLKSNFGFRPEIGF